MKRLLLPLVLAGFMAACAAPSPLLVPSAATSSAPSSAPVSAPSSAPVSTPVAEAAGAAGSAAPAELAQPASLITVNYVCDSGMLLRVRFDNAAGVAYVSPPDGRELRLPQQRAASGIWYATPQHELRGKGNEATWTVGRRMPMQCQAQQP